MKILAERRLFWFLKEGTEFDLNNPAHLDMYVKQILSRGKTQDIKMLLDMVGLAAFKVSFERIKDFLPKEVKIFWEDGLGGINRSSKKNNSHL